MEEFYTSYRQINGIYAIYRRMPAAVFKILTFLIFNQFADHGKDE